MRAHYLTAVILMVLALRAPAQLPAVSVHDGYSRLLVHGNPFIILGGELGNSAAGTAQQADSLLPRIAAMHVNTVLMPVPWNEIEPVEGRFDFSIPDHWIAVARARHLHLVFLWFGAWKNAFSNYPPVWVMGDPARFPRAIAADGQPTEILSTLSDTTRNADSRAFSALMAHLRATDVDQQTVLMVQVENEAGYVGVGGRDRSAAASQLFAGDVPPALMQYLAAHRGSLQPELAARFDPHGHTWSQAFSEDADEAFMAWHYATYIQAVAAAGKAAYALPMYVNTQLPAPMERAGEYPSGGPNPYNLDIYRAAGHAIDFYSPDIYWPDFAYWIGRYRIAGNPLFVPEARGDDASLNALYAFGAGALGFSAFAMEDQPLQALPGDSGTPPLAETYAALEQLGDLLPHAQEKGRAAALILRADSPRPVQTVALGGYLFTGGLLRDWHSGTLEARSGGTLVLQSAPDQFYLIGSGLHITVQRDPDTDNRIAGIVSVDRISGSGQAWTIDERLTGDEDDQGRQILLDAHHIFIYRVRFYTYPR